MKVAVVNNCVPFLKGGAEHLGSALVAKLREYGHEAILIRIPFQWNPPERILESMLSCKLMYLEGVDRVIALKFPVYLVDHPDKVLWLLHQFRQAYDLWDTPLRGMPDTADGVRIRDLIVRTDNDCLSRISRIYTNSQVTSDRLWKFNQIRSQVLYPPLLESDHLRPGELGNYVFFPSRITRAKRQYLAVEAMAHVKSGVHLVVSGQPETQSEQDFLEAKIDQLGVSDRVTLMPRFISESEKAELFGPALGCVYIPYDEDSYGYVTLEAYHCQKPVITCTDSGGTSLLIKHMETGLVVQPDARELAGAMDRLYLDRKLAAAMGEAGYKLMLNLGITWDRVIQCLTSHE